MTYRLTSRVTVTEYLTSPIFVRKYDKRDNNLTTLLGVVIL